jgi:HAD superfamily hydrolase (TIGR01509 family)
LQQRSLKVVLVDFHNTLATCDRWLELEIRLLPGLALERLSAQGLIEGVTSEVIVRAEQLFRELRHRVRESGVELSALEGTRRVLQSLGYEAAEPHLAGIVEVLEEECLAEVEPVPGAADAVWRLRDLGYLLGVVSSAGYPPFVERALELLGVRAAFSEVLTSTGEGIYKSDPEIFLRAVSRLGATPSEAVHVGDHARYDVEAARAAGLAAIWFTGEARRTAHLHGASWEEMARAGSKAEASISKMGELVDAVRKLG